MKETIKIRQSIFETNSSSSHSFSMGPEGRFDDVLPISKDGVIKIPSSSWEDEVKTNNPLDKLSYLLSLIWTLGDDWESYRDFIYGVVLDFTGAEKIEFTPSETVDHQSLDIIDPRDFKDPEFIKEFVFNSGTWLYLVWDSYDPHPGFYEDQEKDKKPLYIIRFDLIDEELKVYYRDLSEYDNVIDNFLYEFTYLPEEGKFVKCTKDGRYPKEGVTYSGNYRFGDLVLTPKIYQL